MCLIICVVSKKFLFFELSNYLLDHIIAKLILIDECYVH
jgi:hypothetical protein